MRRRTRGTLVPGALAVLLACGEPAAPPRINTYAFDFNGDVFHWPAARLPVRFYADQRGHMRALVDRALQAWESQFLYGEFRGVLVPDSTDADVIVLWADSVPPDVPPDTGTPVFACSGVTTFSFDGTGTAIAGPLHAEVGVRIGQSYSDAQIAACVRRIAIHEVGHTLGLFGHSPYRGDVMWAQDTVSLPSQSDRLTVEVLYHTIPNIAPPPR
ncbi:MAG: matrixin family metalloprotease [Gemmatimonadetes bacterium]|nr:matrixin family metalloprotease [Gemmatimonadota bacterium]